MLVLVLLLVLARMKTYVLNEYDVVLNTVYESVSVFFCSCEMRYQYMCTCSLAERRTVDVDGFAPSRWNSRRSLV
jgi:hypothetical protein